MRLPSRVAVAQSVKTFGLLLMLGVLAYCLVRFVGGWLAAFTIGFVIWVSGAMMLASANDASGGS